VYNLKNETQSAKTMTIPHGDIILTDSNTTIPKEDIVVALESLCEYSKSLLNIPCAFKIKNFEQANNDKDMSIELLLDLDGKQTKVTKTLLSVLKLALALHNITQLSDSEKDKRTALIKQTTDLLFK